MAPARPQPAKCWRWCRWCCWMFYQGGHFYGVPFVSRAGIVKTSKDARSDDALTHSAHFSKHKAEYFRPRPAIPCIDTPLGSTSGPLSPDPGLRREECAPEVSESVQKVCRKLIIVRQGCCGTFATLSAATSGRTPVPPSAGGNPVTRLALRPQGFHLAPACSIPRISDQ